MGIPLRHPKWMNRAPVQTFRVWQKQAIEKGISKTVIVLDCEQSLLCSRIREEERRKLSEHDIWRTSRARKRQSRCRSRVPLTLWISLAFFSADSRAKERLLAVYHRSFFQKTSVFTLKRNCVNHECKYMKHIFELRMKDQIEERSSQLLRNLSSCEKKAWK